MHKKIDDIDKKILAFLTKDARMPFLEIASACNVTGAAIHQRVKRLTQVGILSGSQFSLNPRSLGYHTCAFIGIFLDNAALFADVSEKISKILEVVQCYYTTGQYAMFIKVYAKDNEHLKSILSGQIQKIQGVASTETFISLEESFKRTIPVHP